MTTNDDLIKQAVVLGAHKSKKEAVTLALKEYIQRHKQQKIIELFGKIDYHKDYNYKKHRNR